jgi:hypothetical protein
MQCFVYNSVILNTDSPRCMKIRVGGRLELYPWLATRSRTPSSDMTSERKRKQTYAASLGQCALVCILYKIF